MPLARLAHKLKRRILNLALTIIRRHVDQQPDLFVFIYKRGMDELAPITWKARGITNRNPNNAQTTNARTLSDRSVNIADKVLLDVGANLGITAGAFAETARLVYAFEPHPDNYAFLLDQIRIRKITNVKPYQCAISDANGTAKFFSRDGHGIHSLGAHNKGRVHATFEVQQRTLDDFWREEVNEQIGLLKIDVEGFETEVLRGASHLLENKLIDEIIFEFSPRIHKLRGIDIDAPLKVLLEHDYEVFTEHGEPFVYDPSRLPKLCDLIARPA